MLDMDPPSRTVWTLPHAGADLPGPATDPARDHPV